MKLGIEILSHRKDLQKKLEGRRVSLLGHPASVDHQLRHSLDLLGEISSIKLSSAFGPQHGMKGDKQDNMVESADYIDPKYQIPIFSLYGEVRRPTERMMDSFDIILVDLQDLGCRIYTFITTLLYVLEEAARHKKSVWVLDRPNPIGRPVEGLTLLPGQESFVGAGPLPMRHGLTMGELALWFKKKMNLDLDLEIIRMEGYDPQASPGFGWPMELTWINPSPNAPNLNMARCYPGSVMLEGTNLSEGRGTTRPLEVIGAPDIDFEKVLERMQKLAPQWLKGCIVRPCYFEPTFHKHKGSLCSALHFHAEQGYYDHQSFKPFRAYTLAFKAIRQLYPQYQIWRDFHYEYVRDRLAIDVINGGPALREWVDDSNSIPEDLEKLLKRDEDEWAEERESFLLY